MAGLIVSERPDGLMLSGNPSRLKAVFHVLRPYGGTICVPPHSGRLEETARKLSLHGAETKQVGDLVLLTRSGSLPGAEDWSHAEANAASTGASKDQLRNPTKILWFNAAHRWHKFPGQNQVRISGGRLILLEQALLQAMDVYTGRKLWEVELTGEKKDHQRIRDARHRQWGPKGVLSSATQLVVVPDAIYLAHGTSCRVFDPATGKETGRIEMPKDLKSSWKNLRVLEKYVVGTSGQHVLCMDPRTGKQSWRVKANEASLHLAVGGDKVFCAESKGRIFALDLASGKQAWERQGAGPLRYSKPLDMVVTPKGFFKGADGKPLPWPADAKGKRLVIQGRGLAKSGVPGYIAGGKLLTGDSSSLRVYDLRSAKPVGKTLKWNTRGCTGTRASKFILTTRFRGNSAWMDLDSRRITPILGIRPACQVNINLYPADGVLNVPNLTAGCTCNYLPVSTALVPDSALE
jgi:outer membrane protein assembly factor BamB